MNDNNDDDAVPRPDEAPSLTNAVDQPQFFYQQKIGEQQQEIAALKKELLQKSRDAETQKEVVRGLADANKELRNARDELWAKIGQLKDGYKQEVERQVEKKKVELQQKFEKERSELQQQIATLQQEANVQDGKVTLEQGGPTKKRKKCEEDDDDEDDPASDAADNTDDNGPSGDREEASHDRIDDYIKDLTLETLHTCYGSLPGRLHSMCDSKDHPFIQWGEDGKSVHVDMKETEAFMKFLKENFRGRQQYIRPPYEKYLKCFKIDLRLFGFIESGTGTNITLRHKNNWMQRNRGELCALMRDEFFELHHMRVWYGSRRPKPERAHDIWVRDMKNGDIYDADKPKAPEKAIRRRLRKAGVVGKVEGLEAASEEDSDGSSW